MQKEELNACKEFLMQYRNFWKTSNPQISANFLKAYSMLFMTFMNLMHYV